MRTSLWILSALALQVSPAVGQTIDWDRVANIQLAAVRMAEIHKESGFFGGFDEARKCYSSAPGPERGYSKEVEFCMAQDYTGSHAAAGTYSKVSMEARRLSGSPDPEAVLQAMAERIRRVFATLKISEPEARQFSILLKEHALNAYVQARFPSQKP